MKNTKEVNVIKIQGGKGMKNTKIEDYGLFEKGLQNLKQYNELMDLGTSEEDYKKYIIKEICEKMSVCECVDKMDMLAKELLVACDNEDNKNIKKYSFNELLKEICGEGNYGGRKDSKHAWDLYRGNEKPITNEERSLSFIMNTNTKTLHAKGIINEDGTFTVLKGSKMTKEYARSYKEVYEKNLEKLEGVIIEYEDWTYVFVEDYVFDNYTRATECLKGYTGIKKGHWTNYNGTNIDVIYNRKFRKVA